MVLVPVALAKSAITYVVLVLVALEEKGGEVMEVVEKETEEGAQEEAEEGAREEAVENLW